MSKPAQGWRIRIWPWLVLALATLPAVWYVVDFESDIDPEFPRVVRPTFNAYPPPAYRFAEPGDTFVADYGPQGTVSVVFDPEPGS